MSKDLALEMMEQDFHLSNNNQLLNWTKSDITEKAQSIVFGVSEGLADPLQEYIKVRKGKDVLEEAEKNLKPYIDGMTFNKGESYFGCEITEKEMGVKYNYLGCNDQVWNDLNEKMIKLSKSIKDRETFLKGISAPIEIVNTDTSETFTIYPPVKSGKLGKAITIK